MRVLLCALLLATAAAPPLASAGCWEQVPGLCVQDPCDGPIACRACWSTPRTCVDVEACLAGDVRSCVDTQWYCLHNVCPPPA